MFDDDEFDVRPPRHRRFWTSRRRIFYHQKTTDRLPVQQPQKSSDDSFDYVPDAEDFLPTPPKQKGPLSQVPDIRHLRPAIVLFAMFFVASFLHWDSQDVSPVALTHAAIFRDHQWWRLVTALFAHADMEHLSANTPLFLIFGWFLHAFFGWRVFPLATIIVGVLSNLATVSLMRDRASLVGASGMLYGMVAMWMVLYVRFDTEYTRTMRFFRASGASILLLFPTTFHATTSYKAHAFGLLFGFVIAVVSLKKVQIRPLEN